jgi:predicted nicotinamide N-methyase
VNQPELTEEVVPIRGRDFSIMRPRDQNALLTEEAFEREEFMPYWAELWAAGRALAEDVAARALRGARVIELGCGLGLPSLAAAAAGGRVVASDWSGEALRHVESNAELNDLEVETLLLDWFDPPAELGYFDLVIAADVLYEDRNCAALLDLLPALGREVWLADPGRVPAGRFFMEAARDWEIKATSHPAIPNGAIHRLRRR